MLVIRVCVCNMVDSRSGASLLGKEMKLDTALYAEAFLSVYIAQVVAPRRHLPQYLVVQVDYFRGSCEKIMLRLNQG